MATRPRLTFEFSADADRVLLLRPNAPLELRGRGVPVSDMVRVLESMDGTRTLVEIADQAGVAHDAVEAFVETLDRATALDDGTQPMARSGIDAMLEIEDLANELLAKTLFQNVFWKAVQQARPDTPRNVLYGMCIENYHFLFREAYFDSPALCFQGNTEVRLQMNKFYGEEYGHDELLLKALRSLGFSREDLADTIPLPQTMALCNALAYWASYDQLFFFTTLGVLEGKEMKVDSYIEACERLGLDKEFVRPIRAHANLNVEGEHGSLTRAIFQALPCVDPATVRRWRGSTRVFVELYDSFYTGIWDHYSRAARLLRRVSEL